MADATGSFLDMLNEANSIVQADYPGSALYEADLNLELDGSPWRFVFRAGEPKGGTVILKNFEGQFQTPPQYIDEPWLEDVVIPLPISLDLATAQSLCEQQGCGGQISTITLRWPLYPGVTEPEYIFGMQDVGKRCFVGVNSQKVQCEPM
jgi:hypothetical protein